MWKVYVEKARVEDSVEMRRQVRRRERAWWVLWGGVEGEGEEKT